MNTSTTPVIPWQETIFTTLKQGGIQQVACLMQATPT